MASGTVLVTGASTGIGEATALHLKELGFDSVAGVRRDEDADRLGSLGLRTVRLDVTDQGSIAAARDELGSGRVVGQVAVIQQFLPALRANGGRIVNVSSIGGRFALPLVSPYNASKFAIEGISDSLRRELYGQGVDVILIEPGGVKTPIWDKSNQAASELQNSMPPEAERLYGKMIEAVRRATIEIAQEKGIEAREVAEVIGRALTAKRPRTRYLVGTDAKIRGPVSKVMPDRLMDRAVARQLG